MISEEVCDINYVYEFCNLEVQYVSELKNRFNEAGVKYDYVFFPDSDHALIHNFGKRIVYAGIVIDYCREYFK